MEESEQEKVQQEFLESEDNDSVYNAFLALLPDEDQCYLEATQEDPKLFVKKLHETGSSARVVSNAVEDYAGAKLMRMRCEKRRFPKQRLARLDRNLLSAYDSLNDSLESRQLDAEAERDRGRTLLNGCNERAERMQVPGFTLDEGVARGELQCIANGEGYEKRDISWIRK